MADFDMTARAENIGRGTVNSLDSVAVYQSIGTLSPNRGDRPGPHLS
jgi:hypothetical protein